MEEDLANLLSPHENLLQVFFHLLWQKGNGVSSSSSGNNGAVSHVLKGVNIPPTITLNHSRPLNWYFTAKDGTIKMKSRQKLSSLNVVAEFTGKRPATSGDQGGSGNQIPPSSVAAKQRHNLTDVTAMLVGKDSSLEEGLTNRPMPKGTFAQAMSGTEELLSGTLQAFVEPKSNGASAVSNHMIVVNWTPNVMHCERRSNRLNMVDVSGGNRTHSLDDRATLSESSVYVSTTPVVSAHLIQQLEQLCQRIAIHIGEVHQGCRINNMVLHCKMDAHDTIWLMYCSTLRGIRLSKIPGGTPQEMALTLVPPRHTATKKANPGITPVSSSLLQPTTSSKKGQDDLLSDGGTPPPSHHPAAAASYANTSFSQSRSNAKLRAARDMAKVQEKHRAQRREELLHQYDKKKLHHGYVYTEDDDVEDDEADGSSSQDTSRTSDEGEYYYPSQSTITQLPNTSNNNQKHVFDRSEQDQQLVLRNAEEEEQIDEDNEESLQQEEEDEDDLGDCSLCHREMLGNWDATPVQQKHVFFPLQVVAFFNKFSPGTVFSEDDGLKKRVVPGHVQLLQPNLTFEEYSEIMAGRYPGAPKNANSRYSQGKSGKDWFGDQYVVLCQSCAAGLQSMTAGIPIDTDGFIRVPQDNGSSSLKPSRRSRHQQEQQQQAAAAPSRSGISGVERIVPNAGVRSNSMSQSRSRNNTPATQPATTGRPATRSNVLVYDSEEGEPAPKKQQHHSQKGTPSSSTPSSAGGLRDVSNHNRTSKKVAPLAGRPPLAHRIRPASSF